MNENSDSSPTTESERYLTRLCRLIQTFDTAPDLIQYLQQRAELILSNNLLFAPGEEDLLAYYLRNVNHKGQHYFRVPKGRKLVVAEGSWNYFQRHAERRAQLKADKISYAWDELIEKFSQHLLEGTQYYHRTPDGSHQEVGIRFLAKLRELYGILLNPTVRMITELEYPLKRNLEMEKGRNRNQMCHCVSGKKFKKCHGS